MLPHSISFPKPLCFIPCKNLLIISLIKITFILKLGWSLLLVWSSLLNYWLRKIALIFLRFAHWIVVLFLPLSLLTLLVLLLLLLEPSLLSFLIFFSLVFLIGSLFEIYYEVQNAVVNLSVILYFFRVFARPTLLKSVDLNLLLDYVFWSATLFVLLLQKF